jgi:hypothetical protein
VVKEKGDELFHRGLRRGVTINSYERLLISRKRYENQGRIGCGHVLFLRPDGAGTTDCLVVRPAVDSVAGRQKAADARPEGTQVRRGSHLEGDCCEFASPQADS